MTPTGSLPLLYLHVQRHERIFRHLLGVPGDVVQYRARTAVHPRFSCSTSQETSGMPELVVPFNKEISIALLYSK